MFSFFSCLFAEQYQQKPKFATTTIFHPTLCSCPMGIRNPKKKLKKNIFGFRHVVVDMGGHILFFGTSDSKKEKRNKS
jgi:hypothetical protein